MTDRRPPFFEWKLCPPWGLLDGLAHLLHAPRWIQNPLCDRFEEALMGDAVGEGTNHE